jgi:adenylyl cyclase-associated protein
MNLAHVEKNAHKKAGGA